MDQLLNIASQFPTIIFSVLLGIIVIYWLIGLLGIVDLDFSTDAEADLDVDLDADASTSLVSLTGLLLTFGLTSIPVTMVFSIIILLCWLISFYVQLYLLSYLPDGVIYYVTGLITSIVVFFLSLPITGFLIKPLKGMFIQAEAASSEHLVGRDAVIATGKVSETFGQAKVFNDGAEILLDVRCEPEHALVMGDKVLLIEYSKESHSYIVAPFPKDLL